MYYRTVPIIPETVGRVAEVHVDYSAPVKQGDVIFRLDNSKQQASLETARRKIAEVDASMLAARPMSSRRKASFRKPRTRCSRLRTNSTSRVSCRERNPGIVPQRDIEKLKWPSQDVRALSTPRRLRNNPRRRGSPRFIPAEKASAEAALAEAQVDLDKTFIRAGVNGRVEQFLLRPGDIVNPILRPAGILIPEGAGRRALIAGFGQIEGQVMKVGMVAEATCISKPWVIIPMVVTDVQNYIAAGQFRGGEQLLEAQNTCVPARFSFSWSRSTRAGWRA